MITRRRFLNMTRATLQAAIGSFVGAAAVKYLPSSSSTNAPEPVYLAAEIKSGAPRVNAVLEVAPKPLVVAVSLDRPKIS